jgi:hypothetical protein
MIFYPSNTRDASMTKNLDIIIEMIIPVLVFLKRIWLFQTKKEKRKKNQERF